jgi:oligopeptide/dipeptide ABC transporter ATP-binding protein
MLSLQRVEWRRGCLMALLVVKDLKKYFPVKKGLMKRIIGYYKAVDGVSFSIEEGETFGLVGESGCGKTTVGKSILRLIEPTDGKVFINGNEISKMPKNRLRAERRNMQIIFQDPYSSLHPLMTVGDIVAEPIKEYKLASRKESMERVAELFSAVGLNRLDMKKYPHEFSGGQRQRIAIARALATNPNLIVCDEPVSALDVSVQAQTLNLMKKLQKEYKVAYLFIAHGMPVIRHISQRVGVMYLGKLVEVASSKELFENCFHPYTKALISAIPTPDPNNKKQRIILKGEVPDLMNPPPGCLFSNRCRYCLDRCREEEPQLKEISPGYFVACHLND